MNIMPLSQLMELNPDIVLHHVSVTEAEARAWKKDQADVNAFFTKFPNTPLVIDFGDAERIEDCFGWNIMYRNSTLPRAINHMIIKGDNLTTVGNNFLCKCTSLTQLELPKGLTTVGYSFLFMCTNLTQLELPQGLTTVGNDFLWGCSNLSQLKLPQGITTVGNGFLRSTGLTKLKLPQALTTVGGCFLYGCKDLTQLELSQGLTTVGNAFLSDCENLKTVLAHRSMPAWDAVREKIGNKLVEIH